MQQQRTQNFNQGVNQVVNQGVNQGTTRNISGVIFFRPVFWRSGADNLGTSELSDACVNDTQKYLTSTKIYMGYQQLTN